MKGIRENRPAALAAAIAPLIGGGCSIPFQQPCLFQPCAGAADGAGIDCSDPSPQIAVGTGTTAFEPLAEGDEVTLWRGSQGGYHIFGAVATANLGEYADVVFTLTDVESGLLVGNATARTAMVPSGDCVLTVFNLLGIFDPDLYESLVGGEDNDVPCEIFDHHTMRMGFEVTGIDGDTFEEVGTLTAELDVVAVPAPDCQPPPEGA